MYTALPGIRETIWETQINNGVFHLPLGISLSCLTQIRSRLDISALYGDPAYYYYGNYETLGNLTVKIAGVNKYTSYNRALDLETGIHTAEFKSNGAKFAMCVSHPERALRTPAEACRGS